MADKNYYPQPAGDGSATEAAKHVVTIDVEVPAGHGSDPPASAAACAGPYYPGNAKAIFVVATANGVDFERAESKEEMRTADIAEKAERFTVLVGCWE